MNATFREEVFALIKAKQNTDRVAAELRKIADEIEAKYARKEDEPDEIVDMPHNDPEEEFFLNIDWKKEKADTAKVLEDMQENCDLLTKLADDVLAKYPPL